MKGKADRASRFHRLSYTYLPQDNKRGVYLRGRTISDGSTTQLLLYFPLTVRDISLRANTHEQVRFEAVSAAYNSFTLERVNASKGESVSLTPETRHKPLSVHIRHSSSRLRDSQGRPFLLRAREAYNARSKQVLSS
jgi:hypothetical protein